jgi:hypothetical protein
MKQQVSFPVSRGVDFLRNLAQLLLSNPVAYELNLAWAIGLPLSRSTRHTRSVHLLIRSGRPLLAPLGQQVE